MKKILYLCVLLAVCAGCRRANPKIVSCEIMPIEAQARDTAMLQLIEPYKQAQQLEMSVVIGESEQLMHASLPEDLLNAFVSDAMFEYREKPLQYNEIFATIYRTETGVDRTGFAIALPGGCE